ncbi:hypothetical protein WJX72_006505 [[Myrmecia] bisecta]|uniref:Uncharacterized protein n=1 Tax=[Myrmecia] bisecta TaxID=41462 RepID=A0AAW1P3L0_9CHLO
MSVCIDRGGSLTDLYAQVRGVTGGLLAPYRLLPGQSVRLAAGPVRQSLRKNRGGGRGCAPGGLSYFNTSMPPRLDMRTRDARSDRDSGGTGRRTLPLSKTDQGIRYDASTSEIKDDLTALASCLKSGTGQLSRQEAGFLLWFHALQGPETRQEVAAAGAVSACLTVLDHSETTAAERNCAVGVLHNLAQEDENRDAIARGKSQKGNCCLKVLTDFVRECTTTARPNATGAIRQLAESAVARSQLLKSVQQEVDWPVYVNIIQEFGSGTKSRAEMATCCRFLFTGRDDLKAEAGEAGLAAALLKMMQEVKNEAAMQAATGCLWRLLSEESNWRRAAEAGAIRVLVDLIGPPPPRIVELAQMPTPRTLAQAKASQAAARQRLTRMAKEALAKEAVATPPITPCTPASRAGTGEGHARLGSTSERMGSAAASSRSASPDPDPLSRSQRRNGVFSGRDRVTGTRLGTDKMTVLTDQSESMMLEAAEEDDENPDEGDAELQLQSEEAEERTVSEELPLGQCTAGIGWGARLGIETRANAAGCLGWLAAKEVYCVAISQRAGVQRLVPFLQSVMASINDAGNKKAKKKALVLDPLQEQALVNITGALRLLTNLDTNKVRVLKLGALSKLVQLYQDAGRTKIRMNARQIISNMAMLAENGQELAGQGVPEEFLSSAPMHLDKDDIEELKLEFAMNSSTIAHKSTWQMLQQRRQRLAKAFDKRRQAIEEGLDLVYKIATTLHSEPSLSQQMQEVLGPLPPAALPSLPDFGGLKPKLAVSPSAA